MANTEKNYIALILAKMKEPKYRPLRRSELAKALQLHEYERPFMRKALKELVAKGEIVVLRKNRYGFPEQQRSVNGRISIHPKGFGFVTPMDPSIPDVFIPKTAINGARSRDIVKISVIESTKSIRNSDDQAYEGEVLEIVERAYTSLAGILREDYGFQFVELSDSRFPAQIHVQSIKNGLTPEVGNVVVITVEETDSHAKDKRFYGHITEDWGSSEQANIDISILMQNYDLPMGFSDAIIKEAEAMELPAPEDITDGRIDLREKLIFTIDPFDARDFDDAIHMELLDNGEIEIGIHIADVAHFIEPNGAIDEEAIARGNSTYLVDRVIPMLPERLTNHLCSLVPFEDRLAHTVILRINRDGKWLDYETYRSVIHSKARLTYVEAQAIIDGEASEHKPEVQSKVKEIYKITEMLREKRIRSGALDFSMPERKIILDELGKVDEVILRKPLNACQMIEECMLIANQIVARILSEAMDHAIYRVHEEPSEEQWDKMGRDLEPYNLPYIPECNHDLNKLMKTFEDGPRKQLATITILKNLKRARYSEERMEHFGLSFTHYSHFTSPIRRYPDLIAHRILCQLENGVKPELELRDLQYWSQHCSQTERDSDEAEKASKDLKMFAYYHEKLMAGEVGPYKTVITGVSQYGLIVEFMDTAQRGDIPFATLSKDYIEIDEQYQIARASRSGQTWRPGMELECTLMNVDIRERRIELRSETEVPRSNSPKKRKGKKNQKSENNRRKRTKHKVHKSKKRKF